MWEEEGEMAAWSHWQEAMREEGVHPSIHLPVLRDAMALVG